MKYFSHEHGRRHSKALSKYGVSFVFLLVAVISWIIILRLMTLGSYKLLGFAAVGFFSAALILKNPKMGVYLIAATIPMEEIGVVFYGFTMGFTMSKLVGLFAAYVWFLRYLAKGKNPFAGASYLIPIVILMFILTVSVTFSKEPETQVSSLVSFAGYIIMCMMICESLENKKDLVTTINVLIFSFLCVAVIGIMQYFTNSAIFETSDISKARGWTVDAFTKLGRVRGTYADPNAFAIHMVMIFPLSLFFFINEKKKLMLKGFYFAASLIFCLAIFFSLSRAAWLAFIAVVGCTILFQRKSRFSSLLILVLFFGFFTMFGTRYLDRVQTVTEYEGTSRRDPSIVYRIEVYQAAIGMFLDRPILGFGIFQTQNNIRNYGARGNQATHNVFLQVLVENGIFALLLFCWILYSAARRLLDYKALEIDLFYRGVSQAMFATLVGFVTFGLYHDNFWRSLTWYMLGIAYVILMLREKETGVNVKKIDTAPLTTWDNR